MSAKVFFCFSVTNYLVLNMINNGVYSAENLKFHMYYK